MIRAAAIFALFGTSANAFVARDVADMELPGKFETACVQLLMDVDMFWHYAVEGETFERVKERTDLGHTQSYTFRTETDKEAVALNYVVALHGRALTATENLLKGKQKLAGILDVPIEEVTYASMRRGLQERYYHSCRRGVYLRLNAITPSN